MLSVSGEQVLQYTRVEALFVGRVGMDIRRTDCLITGIIITPFCRSTAYVHFFSLAGLLPLSTLYVPPDVLYKLSSLFSFFAILALSVCVLEYGEGPY